MSLENSEPVFKILEFKLLASLDLDSPSSKIYMVVWIDPKNKFKSEIIDTDDDNNNNNNKSKRLQSFVFIVDEATMNSITTASIHVELYCAETEAMFGKSTVLLGTCVNCGVHYSTKRIGTIKNFCVRGLDGYASRGVLVVGVSELKGLPVSNDQLVKTGLAVDFKSLRRTASSFGAKKSISSAVKGFLASFIR